MKYLGGQHFRQANAIAAVHTATLPMIQHKFSAWNALHCYHDEKRRECIESELRERLAVTQ